VLFAGVCSPALWAKVEHGEAPANRAQRSALRQHFDRKPLPLTVAEATAQASLNAAVWQVGEGTPDTIIMIAGAEPVALRVNGSVGIVQEGPVTPVTTRPERTRRRKRMIRPCATATQDADRIDIGASWNEVIDAGIEALKRAKEAK
jgi:hypothetical protein